MAASDEERYSGNPSNPVLDRIASPDTMHTLFTANSDAYWPRAVAAAAVAGGAAEAAAVGLAAAPRLRGPA